MVAPVAAAVIAPAVGQAAGSIIGTYMSRGDRRRGREMGRKVQEIGARQYELPSQYSNVLGERLATEALRMGTPEDLSYYGGMQSANYLRNLDAQRRARERNLGRYGISPSSARAAVELGPDPTREAAYITDAYNKGLLARKQAATGAQERAITSIGQAVDTFAPAKQSFQQQQDAYNAQAADTVRGFADVGKTGGEMASLWNFGG